MAGAEGKEHAPATGARAAHSPAVKDQSNNNPFRLAGVWGRLAPKGAPDHANPARRERACAARAVPATDVHRLAGPPPPWRRRDRAADHQDAGKPLCGRVQRRGYTPARAQAPPPAAQRRALALTPESPPAVSCDALQGGSTARRRTGAGRATPRLGAGRRLPGRQPRAARRAAPRKWQGGATMLTARSGSAWQRTQPYGGENET